MVYFTLMHNVPGHIRTTVQRKHSSVAIINAVELMNISRSVGRV